MGIYTQRPDKHNRTLSEPNFTVFNKMMINTRYVKLPSPASLGQPPESAPRDLGELRNDWVQILVDAGIAEGEPRPQFNEPNHFIV